MNSYSIFLCFLLIFCFSCREEIIVPKQQEEFPCIFNCDTSKLNILWQAPIQNDTADYSVREIIHDEQQIYYGVYYTSNLKAPVYARNTDKGDEVWRWDDYHPRKSQYDPTEIAQTENYVVVNDHHETQAIDKVTGKTKWAYSTKEIGGTGAPIISVWEDNIFHFQTKDTGSSHKRKSHLVTTNIESPKWDTLYTFHNNDSTFVSPGIPKIWITPNQDVVLLIIVNNWTYDGVGDRTDLVAYNFTQRDTQFIIKNVLPGGTGRGHGLTVAGNSAAALGTLSIAHVDLISGEKKWEKFITGSERFSGSRPLIYKNFVITNSNEKTYAFDLNSGGLRWWNSDLVQNIHNMEYNGKLIASSAIGGRITIIDIDSGTTILHEKSPNNLKYPDADYFWQGLTLDKSKGVLYASDGYFIQCIKLP